MQFLIVHREKLALLDDDQHKRLYSELATKPKVAETHVYRLASIASELAMMQMVGDITPTTIFTIGSQNLTSQEVFETINNSIEDFGKLIIEPDALRHDIEIPDEVLSQAHEIIKKHI